MEDTQILKHHYIYSFRWDATNDKSTLDYMENSFKELEISNWIGKHEVSEKGKPHFQMAVWTERKLLAKEMDKVRKRFIRSTLTSKTKQPVSFVSGRKIQSLIAYCTKDKGTVIKQLPEHCIERLPKWKNKSAEKIIFQEKLRDHIVALVKPYNEKPHIQIDVKESVDSIVQFHIDNDIQPPSKGRMLYYLVKYHIIGVSDYRDEVYNFRMFKDNNYY